MESREPQSLTAPLALPNSVGQSLLTDDDIVSFLSQQNSQSSIIEDLEPTEVSQGVSAPVESSSTNESPHTPEDDSVQADAVKRLDNGHAQAGTNRTAWAMDVVAIFVAAACLISIYTVLGSLDNKEQPQWPLPATLNLGALIALLATILRSMIMGVLESVISQLKWRWFKSTQPLSHLEAYDEASRGPWGAAKFFPLFGLNWATWGAFVSILSIAISTLTQQAFQTSACSRPISHGDAFIPIAQTCPGGTKKTVFGRTRPYILDPRIKAALISGLAGIQSARPLNPTCSSGNCTFLALNGVSYSSVVISTDCVDVSPFVNESEALYYSLPREMEMSLNYEQGYGWSQMMSTTTLDHDFYDKVGVDLKLSETQKTTANRSCAVVGIMMPTTNPCEDASAYQSYFQGGSLRTPLPLVNTSSCAQLELPNVTTLPGFFSVTAAICWFYPALQHFTGSIQQGSFHEQAIGDPIPLEASFHEHALVDFIPLEAEGALLDETGGYKNAIGWWLFSDHCIIEGSIYGPGNFSDAPGALATVQLQTAQNDNFVNVTAPQRCLYGLDVVWMNAISGKVAKHYTNAFSPIETTECAAAENYTEIICIDKWWLGNLYNGGNASRDSILHVLNQGFSSMSDQMRMMGTDWNGNPSNVSGTVYHTSLCIEFHWEWLFFPLVLVLATFLLLVAVMVDTRREVVWKSSILPLLFYGLDERKTLDGLRLQAEKELHATAKTTMVDFSFAKGAGWRFRGSSGTQ